MTESLQMLPVLPVVFFHKDEYNNDSIPTNENPFVQSRVRSSKIQLNFFY